ncbi:MAG: hypothetical protein MUF40_00270 [Gemmatimonadaceae bacterium]|nr:hypothetical protein [Gemmatimonadaceae bacterium]
MSCADRRRVALGLLALAAGLGACVPRVAPLVGATRPVTPLPRLELPAHHQRVVFRWRIRESELEVRGDGAARIAPPDSARLDLFVAGGLGSGAAWVVGDDLRLGPAPEALRRALPPPVFLWAALGRFALPPGRDTLLVSTDSTLVIEIGPTPRWRAELRGGRLVRLERVEGEKLVDRLERRADGALAYLHAPTRRQLFLDVQRTDSVAPFDADIWAP